MERKNSILAQESPILAQVFLSIREIWLWWRALRALAGQFVGQFTRLLLSLAHHRIDRQNALERL